MNQNTKDSIEYIKDFLKKNKDKWFESNRKNNTGIGKTLEDILGKEEDNLSESDFDGLELKSQRNESNSLITLFTKSPSVPRGVNTYLRETYGTLDTKYNSNTLHTTIYGNKKNTYKETYQFKISTNNRCNRLELEVYDMNGVYLNEKEVYWDYDILQSKFDSKIHSIGLVKADSKKIDGKEYFKYNGLKLLINPSFDKFLECINNGLIAVDIRIGVYGSGKNVGKTHDHGTGFRIFEKNLNSLYKDVIEISVE